MTIARLRKDGMTNRAALRNKVNSHTGDSSDKVGTKRKKRSLRTLSVTDEKDVVLVAQKDISRVVEETDGGEAVINHDLTQERFLLVPDLHHSVSAVV